MKTRKSYKEEVQKLFKAIDISIDAYQTHFPHEWTQETVDSVKKILLDDKERILNCDQKFKTMASLKYEIDAVLTYFQEASGDTVEYFWRKIKEEQLDYKRVNKLDKILKRGKIRGRIEYDYVTDIIVVAEQSGLTTKEETKLLGNMLEQYEGKKKKN